jgi:WD40 repeat protein
MVWDLEFSRDGQYLLSAGGSAFSAPSPDAVRIWEVWGPGAGRCVREFRQPLHCRRATFGEGGESVTWARADGVVQTGATTTGEVTMTSPRPDISDNSVMVSPGAKCCARFAQHSWLCVEEVATGRPTFATDHVMVIHTIGFSQDARILAVCGQIENQGLLRWWDVEAGKELGTIEVPAGLRARPTFSPDGRWLALGTVGGVRLWETATGRMVQNLAGHAGHVLAVAFSPDGRHLATAGSDGTVRYWSAETGEELLLIRGHQGRVTSLSFHPSGRYLASGGQQPAEIKVWDLTRHQEYVTIAPASLQNTRAEAIGFGEGGEVVRVLRAAGCVQSARVSTGMDVSQKPMDFDGRWLAPATTAAFSPAGDRVAARSRADARVVKLFAGEGERELYQLEHTCDVVQMAFSRDGRRLVTSGLAREEGRREIKVWDVATGREHAPVPFRTAARGNGQRVAMFGVVALSADGSLLGYDEAEVRRTRDGRVELVSFVVVRDLRSGQARDIMVNLPYQIAKLAFSPDDRYLAVSSLDHGVNVYDCRAGRLLFTQPLGGSVEEACFDVSFSPDGRRLAGVSRVQTLVWDVATGQQVLTLRGAPPRAGDNGFNPRVAWSPDGRRLAASNWNSNVSVWDATDRSTPATKVSVSEAAEARGRRP